MLRRLLGTTAPGHHDCSIQELKSDIHLWISFTPNAAVLFVDVAIQPEVRFIAKQNCWKKSSKIGRPDWTTSVAVMCQKSFKM
ncbi:hypothetical protein TNCV_3861811 [Trichonephila clavipes]|nr:hypothetical protein TNCV_3861811 [Trichonephila clavipes]